MNTLIIARLLLSLVETTLYDVGAIDYFENTINENMICAEFDYQEGTTAYYTRDNASQCFIKLINK